MSKQLELIKNRRTSRIFKAEAVEPEKIEAITKAILWSPTSKNNRPWEFVWVDDRTTLDKLAACKPHGAELIKNAPLALVILADPNKSDVWVEDTAIAASFAQLVAEDLGLGSCWVQVHKRMNTETESASDCCKRIVNAPDHLETAYIIAIGYKQKERQPYSEENLLRDRIHFNSF